MVVYYVDILTGDRILSENYNYKEMENGNLLEVEGKPIAPELSEDCTSIISEFGLQEITERNLGLNLQAYVIRMEPHLEREKRTKFMDGFKAATKLMHSNPSGFKMFTGPSAEMEIRGIVILARYKDGATHPTFLYLPHGLVRVDPTCFRDLRQHIALKMPFQTPPPPLKLGSSNHCNYQDIFTGDIILSDIFPREEVVNGVLWKVKGMQRITKRRKNDHKAVPVINIVDTFRLKGLKLDLSKHFRSLMVFLCTYLLPVLEPKEADEFARGVKEAATLLASKIEHLKAYVGASVSDGWNRNFIFKYQKGLSNPTFFYFAHGLRRQALETEDSCTAQNFPLQVLKREESSSPHGSCCEALKREEGSWKDDQVLV